MKKINKTYYWIGLIFAFSAILVLRYFGYFIEIRKEFYYTIFGLWICLILLPLFGEIEFFGIKLKKEIDELKRDVKEEIRSIRFDINNSNNQQIIFSYGPPPPDSKIPQLEKEINSLNQKNKLTTSIKPKKVVKYKKSENESVSELDSNFNVADSTIHLFQIRFNLEALITQIWDNYKDHFNYNTENVNNVNRMLVGLNELQLIDNEELDIIRGILSICNIAVHGKMTTKKQRDFVFKYSKVIYDTLWSKINNN